MFNYFFFTFFIIFYFLFILFLITNIFYFQIFIYFPSIYFPNFRFLFSLCWHIYLFISSFHFISLFPNTSIVLFFFSSFFRFLLQLFLYVYFIWNFSSISALTTWQRYKPNGTNVKYRFFPLCFNSDNKCLYSDGALS